MVDDDAFEGVIVICLELTQCSFKKAFDGSVSALGARRYATPRSSQGHHLALTAAERL